MHSAATGHGGPAHQGRPKIPLHPPRRPPLAAAIQQARANLRCIALLQPPSPPQQLDRHGPYSRPPPVHGDEAANPARPALSRLRPWRSDVGRANGSPAWTDTGGGAAAAIQGLAPNTPKGKWRRGLPSTPPAGRGMWASRAKHSAHKSRNPAQTRAAGAGGVGAQRCNRTARASTHTHTTTTTPRPQHQQHQQQTRTNNNKQQHTTTNNNKQQQHTTTRNNQAQDETKGSPDTLADSPADLVSPRVVRGM